MLIVSKIGIVDICNYCRYNQQFKLSISEHHRRRRQPPYISQQQLTKAS